MEGLSKAFIASLYAKPRKASKGANGAFYLLQKPGCTTLEMHAGAPSASQAGSFQGRVGSMRRTRKGATRRNPNGSRRYVNNTNQEQVVAYKV